MMESIILGAIQGVSEWLPVSSEGMIILAKTHLFGGSPLRESVEIALFLHLGTFLAACAYFRKDVKNLIFSVFKYKNSSDETRKVLRFLIVATIVSGSMGYAFLSIFDEIEDSFVVTGKALTAAIGILLLVTGYLQLSASRRGNRQANDLKTNDSMALGAAQGFAALPGLSRSGLTVSVLLLRNFKDHESLRLSFLLSLPIVLGGNIALNLNGFSWSYEKLIALIFSFLFGFLTIDALLRLARRVQFGWFVVFFGVLMIISFFV